MEYPVSIQGFEKQKITLKSGGIFSSPTLLVNGQTAPKGSKQGQLLLHQDNGTEMVAQLKVTNPLDSVPKIIIEGQQIEIIEPLRWYQLIWIGMPILLIFVGGILGGILGGIAVGINRQVFRSDINEVLKYISTGGVLIVSLLVYFTLVVVLNSVFQ